MIMPLIALPTGPCDWSEHVFPRAVFERRLAGLRAAMRAEGLTHAVVYGNVFDHEALAFFSHFTPKLGAAVMLTSLDGPARLLFAGGPGMAPSARRLTWIEDVAASRGLERDVDGWLAPAEGRRVGALCGEGVLQGDFEAMSAGAGGALAPLDHVFKSLRDAEDIASFVRPGAALLQQAAERLYATARPGSDFLTAILDAERFACRAGAQDIRWRVGRKPWGSSLAPPDRSFRVPASLALALAVRRNGWWAQGGFVVGDLDGVAGEVRTALEEKREGRAYVNRVAFPEPPLATAGLRQVCVKRRGAVWSALRADAQGAPDCLFMPPGL